MAAYTMAITPDPATVAAHKQVQLTAMITVAGGDTFDATGGGQGNKIGRTTWSSSNPAVATVASGRFTGGLVTGVTTGTVTITASYVYGGNIIGFPGGGAPDPPDSSPTVDTVSVTVTAGVTPGPPPPGRFLLGFDDRANELYPTWTRIDTVTHVASWSIDRGRLYEIDRTDTGRATVSISDPDGTLDPTNATGPYYGKIKPLIQAILQRYDPVADEWQIRFRGYVEDLTYVTDPSQTVNRLQITLVDLFDRLSRAEMQPLACGDTPPEESIGQIYYPQQKVEARIARILDDFAIPASQRAILTSTVYAQPTVYSPGEAALSALQEAADADMPGVSNLYCDRQGRVCFHTRHAKFHPVADSAAAGDDVWPYREWKAGDGAAVNASPDDTAQIRAFGFTRGLSKIINSAMASPVGVTDEALPELLFVDTASVSANGVSSWSAQDLIVDSTVGGGFATTECSRFASYYARNYGAPQDRVEGVTFRSLRPDDARAAANWELLGLIDIADSIELTVALPGGGGFETAHYFVEGIHEETRPLDPEYDDVTVTLDLSPRDYFSYDPWGGG